MEGSYSKTNLLFLLFTALTVALPQSTAAKERCHPEDKKALLRIKQQSFPNSTVIDSWTPASDCCDNWASVTCDDKTNRIVTFDFIFTDIEGTPFPSGVADLPYLQRIVFHNQAPGPFPSSLAALHRLVFLDLSINRLSGPIPSFLAALTRLTYLDLSHNLLSGSIPPSLASLSRLSTLDLSNNRLSGKILSAFGSFKSSQMDLGLSYNRLSGKIPRSLRGGKFSQLELAGNKLTGDPSFLLGKDKTALWNLNLADNRFSFDLTRVEFPDMMNVLDLSQNRIRGRLPEGLAHLVQLNGSNVSYNRLCGRIPTGGTLGQFDKTTYFHNKCLCGTPLPACKSL